MTHGTIKHGEEDVPTKQERKEMTKDTETEKKTADYQLFYSQALLEMAWLANSRRNNTLLLQNKRKEINAAKSCKKLQIIISAICRKREYRFSLSLCVTDQ